MRIGTYRIVCGNCHIRGHRADGNHNNDACKAPKCVSYFMCGQKNKHPEHFDELKKNEKELKELIKEIENAQLCCFCSSWCSLSLHIYFQYCVQIRKPQCWKNLVDISSVIVCKPSMIAILVKFIANCLCFYKYIFLFLKQIHMC